MKLVLLIKISNSIKTVMSNFDKTPVNPFLIHDEINFNDDDEDEIDDNMKKKSNSSIMTESYCEITNNTTNNQTTSSEETDSKNHRPSRPNSLVCETNKEQPNTRKTFPYYLEGTVSIDDSNMTHFVAENLEYKIKLASPVTRKESSINSRTSTPSNASSVFQKQFYLLNNIEMEAQYLATSVDSLSENLCNLLHSISSITADNVETYKNAVNKLTDCIDGNIKSMYTIMAKTEEISNAMKPADALSGRIRELKRLVDMLDSNI